MGSVGSVGSVACDELSSSLPDDDDDDDDERPDRSAEESFDSESGLETQQAIPCWSGQARPGSLCSWPRMCPRLMCRGVNRVVDLCAWFQAHTCFDSVISGIRRGNGT